MCDTPGRNLYWLLLERDNEVATTLEQVYETFNDGLRSFVRSRVDSPEVAEDILQDVYLKIHSGIGSLHGEENLRAWVYTVARNAVHDHYRSTRETSVLPEIPYEAEDPLNDAMAAGLNASVRAMIECLSPQDRQTLILTEYEGLTQKQLAEQLNLSVPGAKSRVQRARTRLKTLLLACCHFELDNAGRVMNYYPRNRECCSFNDTCN